MKSTVINIHTREALKRKGKLQSQLARETNRAVSTVNGYLNTEPAPIDAMVDIASALDDSILSQEFSYKVFSQFPPMESDVFQNNIHSYAVIQDLEEAEREKYEEAARLALTKRKEHLDKADKDAIWNYAMNYLDEIFVEIRHVISLLNLLDMSLMQAIKKRRPLWISKRYAKE